MSEMTLWRIIIGIAGLALLVAIYFYGLPKRPEQGRRLPEERRGDGARVEPILKDLLDAEGEGGAVGAGEPLDEGAIQSEMELQERRLSNDAATLAASAAAPRQPANPRQGMRRERQFDKIVTLIVAARDGYVLRGPDLVVAAEKAGLVYGHLNIFHRLVDGHPEQDPIFSVANMVKPGHFDVGRLQALETPGISFFMTLPAPVPALDAWEALLPTAQRMAELLGGVVLDEQRNALGRQRIAHIRDELRAYDRQQEKRDAPTKW